MNLLKFSKPLNYLSFSESAINQLLGDLEKENCFGIPLANISETKENFKIELSVAGFSKEQIGIQYQDNLLLVKGTSEDKLYENERYLSREFGLKSFIRRFSIPRTVDSELIYALFTDGILTIMIPKKEEVKEKEPKDIIIN